MASSRPPKPNKSRRAPRSAVVRRPPEKGWPRIRHEAGQLWERLLETPRLWAVLFVLLSGFSLAPRPLFFAQQVEVGSVAGRSYVADSDLSVPDEDATREARLRAQDEVLPVYDLDRGLEALRRQQLADLFASGRQLMEEEALPQSDDPPPLPLEERLRRASGLLITAQEAAVLARRGFSIELEDRLSGILTRLLRQGVVAAKDQLLEHRVRGITVRQLPAGETKVQLDLYGYLDHPDQVLESVRQDLRSWDGLSSQERRIFTDFIVNNVEPNLIYNSVESAARREEASSRFGTVHKPIRQGEVIARKGDVIGPLAARAISQMAGSREVSGLVMPLLGTLLVLVGSAWMVWLGIGPERRRDRSRPRLFSECLLLLTLAVLSSRFAHLVATALAEVVPREPFNSVEGFVYAIPFGGLALGAVLLYGRGVAWVLALVFSVIVARIAGPESVWLTMVYSLAGSVAAIHAIDPQQFKQRSATTRAGLVVGTVNVVVILTLRLLAGDVERLDQLGLEVLCGFAGGLLVAAVTSFALPILEGLLSITTHIKLVELANPNLPLLRRIAFEAPGTFQHSLAVANLAKAGCEAIDADALLVNTCALYHDVGKIFRPHYFIENQVAAQNPHDKIQPTMSALILINHVKEGLELARQHNLPSPICEGIEQHHGTRLIKFFYNRATERRDRETEEVREEDFRYPGPKPRSREMGVLMLADAVEAASRTLVDPSRQKLRSVLRAIFDDCLRDGQLDQADLTLGHIRRVEEAFFRVLANIYHRRIDYPGFEFNRGAKPPSAGGGEPADRSRAVG